MIFKHSDPLISKNSLPIKLITLVLFAALTAATYWAYQKDGSYLLLASTVFFLLITILILITLFNNKQRSLQISEEGLRIPRKDKSELVPWVDYEYFNILAVNYVKLVSFQHTVASGRKRTPGGYTIAHCKNMPPLLVAVILESCREYFTTGKKPDDIDDE